MLTTVENVHLYVDTELSDSVLEAKLRGLELMIRAYTHNNFQQRNIRSICKSDGDKITGIHEFFAVGDTIEISGSFYNNGIYTIVEIEGDSAVLDRPIFSEEYFTVTKVVYPEDVILGSLTLLDWDLNRRDKVGVQSETISRHSITYFNMDGGSGNSAMGFPSSLLGFLEPYRKARF